MTWAEMSPCHTTCIESLVRQGSGAPPPTPLEPSEVLPMTIFFTFFFFLLKNVVFCLFFQGENQLILLGVGVGKVEKVYLGIFSFE